MAQPGSVFGHAGPWPVWGGVRAFCCCLLASLSLAGCSYLVRENEESVSYLRLNYINLL